MSENSVPTAPQPVRSVPPRVCRVTPLPLPPVRTFTLDNGVTVVIHHCPDLAIARFSIVTAGGAAEAQFPQIASLAAVMRSEGTTSMTASEIAQVLDYNGAWSRSDVSPHHIATSMFVLTERVADVLPVLKEIVFAPTFPHKELSINIERFAAQADIISTTSRFNAAVASRRLTYGASHPFAAVPTAQSYRNTTRDEIVEFHSKYAIPADATIFITGNITPALEETIRKFFCSCHSEIINQSQLNVQPFDPSPGGILETVPVEHSVQSTVLVTIPAIPRSHLDYLHLRLAVKALGGYFGSRLSQNIREEKGYTYGINAALLGYREGGIVQISTDCDHKYAKMVVDEILAELRRLESEPLSPLEMERLRQAETSGLIEITDSPFSVADMYQTIYSNGLPCDYYAMRCAAIQSLTSDKVSALASMYLNPDRAITVVAGQ